MIKEALWMGWMDEMGWSSEVIGILRAPSMLINVEKKKKVTMLMLMTISMLLTLFSLMLMT